MRFSPALRAAALVSLLAACSHTGETRSPSSLPVVDMSVTLDEIMSSPDPRAASRAFVDRLLRLEVRAHDWLYQFDATFAAATQPVPLFGEPAYRKLMIARPMIEHLQDKIVSFYGDAFAITRQTPPPAGDRLEEARLVITGVHDALLHANNDVAERVLLNELMKELREVRDQVTGKQARPHPIVAPLEGEELAKTAAQAGPAIAQLISALPDTDDIKEKVEAREAEVAKRYEAADRSPQSIRFAPSTGPNGSIDGFEFPKGTWALTFDDGPHPTISEQDLANLQAAKVKGTYFWLAKNLDLHPAVVKMVQAAGMPIGNHSWNHPDLTSAKDLARLDTNLDKEINQSTAEDIKVLGGKPRFFRCPYGAGAKDPTIRGMIAKLGMISVIWNVDSLDWKDSNPVTVQARVEQEMKVNGRGIILFHDIHTPAVTVVPKLIAENKGKIQWVTIPEIVDSMNGVPPGASPPAEEPAGAPAATGEKSPAATGEKSPPATGEKSPPATGQ